MTIYKQNFFFFLIWNASRICVSSLRRGHANLLCIVPILVYVLPKRALYKQILMTIHSPLGLELFCNISSEQPYWQP